MRGHRTNVTVAVVFIITLFICVTYSHICDKTRAGKDKLQDGGDGIVLERAGKTPNGKRALDKTHRSITLEARAFKRLRRLLTI